MSGPGNCYDNAVVESFFATLKRERVHRQSYRTRAEATTDIFKYTEIFYNRQRRHSTIGHMSPEQFETANRKGRIVKYMGVMTNDAWSVPMLVPRLLNEHSEKKQHRPEDFSVN
jgi:hypothetical protein